MINYLADIRLKKTRKCYCRLRAVSSTVVSHDVSIEQVHDVLVVVIFNGYQKKVGESEIVRSVHGSTAWSKQKHFC